MCISLYFLLNEITFKKKSQSSINIVSLIFTSDSIKKNPYFSPSVHSSKQKINEKESYLRFPFLLPPISRSPSWFPATGLARPPGKALPSICFYRQVILEPSILVGRGLAHVRIRHSGIRGCCCVIVDAFMFASARDVYGGRWSLCSRAILGTWRTCWCIYTFSTRICAIITSDKETLHD